MAKKRKIADFTGDPNTRVLTVLTPEEETTYQKWRGALPKNLQSEFDYDLRGLWKSDPNIKPSANLHFPDTYKLPNHPTFSNESIYYNGTTPGVGGYWTEDMYTPNPQVGPPVSPTFAKGGKIKGYANGGSVPVEVEDNEIAQTPDGQVMQFDGATHEEGGIPINLPVGTKIFSDRIEIDGKTMQERKLSRDKKLRKLGDLLDKNPTDKLLQGTVSRQTTVLGMEEEQDMAIQEMARQTQKFANGGVVSSIPTNSTDGATGSSFPWMQLINGLVQIGGQLAQGNQDKVKNPLIDEYAGLRPYANGGYVIGEDGTVTYMPEPFDPNAASLDPNYANPNASTGWNQVEFTPNQPVYTPVGSTTERKPAPVTEGDDMNINQSAGGMTWGNAVGMVGNLVGTLGPLFNTLSNREGDTPNINAFQNFGVDAINANTEAQGYANTIKQNQLESVRIAANSARMRNRDSARGINTIRALDTATDLVANQSTNSVYNAYADQMMNLLGIKSQLENQQDAYVMQGEQARDLADRQDRDNFSTQLGQDINNLGTGIQAQGRYMNQQKQNADIADLINELSKYGVTFTRQNGKLKLTKKK